MSNDEIIEMARQVGIIFHGLGNTPEELETFAKLIADKARQELRDEVIYTWVPPSFVDFAIKTEREACAVTAEEHFCGCGRGNCPEEDVRAHEIAQAIRARGEA